MTFLWLWFCLSRGSRWWGLLTEEGETVKVVFTRSRHFRRKLRFLKKFWSSGVYTLICNTIFRWHWVMKMFGRIVFLFLFILQDASPNTEVNDCPDGAIAVGESCYFFSSETLNWFAAQEVKCTHYKDYLDTLPFEFVSVLLAKRRLPCPAGESQGGVWSGCLLVRDGCLLDWAEWPGHGRFSRCLVWHTYPLKFL